MTLKEIRLEFPKDKSVSELYDYIYKLTEALDIILSGINEENLSDELKEKLGLGGE